jgi:Mrp family chromosome partitioning ATPase
LLRDKARTGKHVFAFTAVKSDAGATTVILNTAVVLQQLGIRVLVVDANSFSPSAELNTSAPGLSEYLSGKVDLESISQTIVYQDEPLQAIGFGTALMDGIQRLDRFKQAVASWSEQYEIVLIDLPPVLLSADAELLIEVLGQVFLVLEAQSVTKGEVTRAKRVLSRLDPQAVGLFVNRIPMFQGAGYMQELMVETLMGKKFSDFMSTSNLSLKIQMLRARLTQKLTRKPKRSEPD